jgi:hypothetical protein
VTRCIGANGIGSDGAALSVLRAALPHDVAGGVWPVFVNVVGNDEIARGLANGITEPECVSGAAIARGLSSSDGGRALVCGEDFEGIRQLPRCKTIAIA